MKPLNKMEKRIFDYVRQRIDAFDPPSLREIGQALDIKSTSTVHKHLHALEEKGYLTITSGTNRAIRLARRPVTYIPLVGTVAAGSPIFAEENIEDYLSMDSMGYPPEDLFALRVRGQSMMGAAILDGDIIVAVKTATAQQGQIVVALVDNEATVKRFYKEDGHYRLQPENKQMQPLIFDEVQVLGRVVAVVRRLD